MRYNTKSYPNKENNDCGVRALAAAAGVSYTQAYKALELAGRQKKRGSYLSRWIRMGMIHLPGIRFEVMFDREIMVGFRPGSYGVCREVTPAPTLKQFVKANPTGNFLVTQTGHAFAVRNGVVIDANRPGARVRVKQAWRVTAV